MEIASEANVPLTISSLNFGCPPPPDGDAEAEEPAAAATSSPAGMSMVTGPSKFVGKGSSGLNRLEMFKIICVISYLGPMSCPSIHLNRFT